MVAASVDNDIPNNMTGNHFSKLNFIGVPFCKIIYSMRLLYYGTKCRERQPQKESMITISVFVNLFSTYVCAAAIDQRRHQSYRRKRFSGDSAKKFING